ncbi:MAG: hypothetical protein ACXQS4_03830 [Methermicoccaceae archaeon]
MKLTKVEAIETDEKGFAEFWSQQYEAGKYTDEEGYEPFLNAQKELTEGAIGEVSYEIYFNHHFYQYEPPRPLEEVEAEILEEVL